MPQEFIGQDAREKSQRMEGNGTGVERQAKKISAGIECETLVLQ
jgi:hypothetical protein